MGAGQHLGKGSLILQVQLSNVNGSEARKTYRTNSQIGEINLNVWIQ